MRHWQVFAKRFVNVAGITEEQWEKSCPIKLSEDELEHI